MGFWTPYFSYLSGLGLTSANRRWIARPVDFSHAAGTDQFLHFVVAHLAAGMQRDLRVSAFKETRPGFVAGPQQCFDFASQSRIGWAALIEERRTILRRLFQRLLQQFLDLLPSLRVMLLSPAHFMHSPVKRRTRFWVDGTTTGIPQVYMPQTQESKPTLRRNLLTEVIVRQSRFLLILLHAGTASYAACRLDPLQPER
jgi:hypothetical protein